MESSINSNNSPQPRSKGIKLHLTVIAVALILIITPLWALVPQIFRDDKASKIMDLEDMAWEVHEDLQNFLYYNASNIIISETTEHSGMNSNSPDLDYLNDHLNRSFSEFLSENYQHKIAGVKVEVTVHEIQLVFDNFKTNDNVKNGFVTEEGDSETFIAGKIGSTTGPTYYKIYGKFTVKLTDSETENTIVKTMKIERSLFLPEPFISAKLDEFRNNANTEASDIGRMVRYMLNTVARYRAKVGYGQGPYDSPRNIINEGDIELAVNLAIILEELFLFRTYDNNAVAAIDSFYFDQSETTRAGSGQYNPTGKRVWGEAEISNYIRYITHLPEDPYERSLKNLVQKYLNHGYIDPADLLVLYVCLDNEPYPGAIELDPNDETSVLEDEILLNPRANYGTGYDVTNLKYILNTALEQPFEFSKSYSYEKSNWVSINETLEVDHEPDYLVVGSEQLLVENIYPPRGWYTNVDLAKVQGNASRSNMPIGTRCPKQPPLLKPPDHDFQMQWDLVITGNFELRLRRASEQNYADGTHHNPWYNRTIALAIPVSIYLWVHSLPQNNAIVFKNLNKGVLDPETADWIIEPDAIAYEYFTEHLWKALRAAVGVNFDYYMTLIHLIGSRGPYGFSATDGPEELEKQIIDTVLWRISRLRELLEANPPWWELITFMDEYMEPQNLTGADLDEIWVDGYSIAVEADFESDAIELKLSTKYGYFTLIFEAIHNLKTRNLAIKDEISIPDIINYQATIDLAGDSDTGTILASGEVFNQFKFNINSPVTNAELKLTPDSDVPFIFLNSEEIQIATLSVDIPILHPFGGTHALPQERYYDSYNLTIEMIIGLTENSNNEESNNLLNLKINEIIDAINQAYISYDAANHRTLQDLINKAFDKFNTELDTLLAEYNELNVGVAVTIDQNEVYGTPITILLFQSDFSYTFKSFNSVVNWFKNNCLDMFSIMRYSASPLIDIGYLMINTNAHLNDFGNIVIILTIRNPDNNGTDISYFKYTFIKNLELILTSDSSNWKILAGYNNTVPARSGNELREPLITIAITKL